MAVSILGEHISLIRPERMPKPLIQKDSVWKTQRPRRKTFKLTEERKMTLAAMMGFEYSGNKETC